MVNHYKDHIIRTMCNNPDHAKDTPENVNDNPKSWVAWKREAESLQSRLAAAEARLKEAEGLLEPIIDLISSQIMILPVKYDKFVFDWVKRSKVFLSTPTNPDLEEKP